VDPFSIQARRKWPFRSLLSIAFVVLYIYVCVLDLDQDQALPSDSCSALPDLLLCCVERPLALARSMGGGRLDPRHLPRSLLPVLP
jgi:hypothetical protein